MKLYCDMDGVAADFETGYERTFGIPCTKTADDVDWDLVASVPNFYETLPPMPDLWKLWDFIKWYRPTMLTGVPKRLLGDANTQKHRWIYRHLGPDTDVICTLSKNKSEYCQPGDIIIDDWEKHKRLWVQKGGIWVTHTDADSTIVKLMELGLRYRGEQ